jgi:tetratricopeptide (TPR) repeat protein
MTLVVIQTAVVTYWFTLADDSQGDAGRDAQILAMRDLGHRTMGSIKTGYDETAAYQRWVEMNTLAKLSEAKGDEPAAERYYTIRDRVAELSPLLQPPYFNPDQDISPDFYAYEADTYIVETATSSERFANQYNLKAAWFEKASAYTMHLTLLAVALFLFGLAATAKSRIRGLFVVLGVFFAGATLVWMVGTYARPVSGMSDDAIKAYARGVGLAYQGKSKEAIAAFDDALKIAPTYANALRDRAFAYLDSGENDAAAASFEQARAAGDQSSETVGSLGWTYYLAGKLNQSILASQLALKTSPNEMWIHYNLALSLLASGQIQAAQAEYANAMNSTTSQVAKAKAAGKQPPETLWWSIDAGAVDLDELIACLTQQTCDASAPAQSIANSDAVKRAAIDLRVQLKELSVALEYTGKPPAAAVAATIEPFTFAQDVAVENGEIMDIAASTVFTDTENPIYVFFEHKGLRNGQDVVIKVYYNNEEDPRLRVAQEIEDVEPSGDTSYFAINTGGIPFWTGNYKVEMFIDSRLVQEGEFSVE